MTRSHRFCLQILILMNVLALGACATLPPASGDRETSDLSELVADTMALGQRLGAEHVLVVFDLDNTLLAMEQALGSDQWYEWQKELAAEHPCAAATVPDRFAVQGAMYFASAMRPTQPDAADQVRSLQDAGLPVIALTSRGVEYRLQTFRELRRSGFDFRRSAIGPEAGWPENFIPARGSRPARYEDGVFLTSGQHKGEMLMELLERTGTRMPRAIVMADDKRANLDAVIETFTELGPVLRTWRYAAEDQAVAQFDPDDSDRLWRTLEPALRVVQEELGPDNFELPPPGRPECSG